MNLPMKYWKKKNLFGEERLCLETEEYHKSSDVNPSINQSSLINGYVLDPFIHNANI